MEKNKNKKNVLSMDWMPQRTQRNGLGGGWEGMEEKYYTS